MAGRDRQAVAVLGDPAEVIDVADVQLGIDAHGEEIQGQVDDIDSLTGELITKTIGLNLKIDGADKPYAMALRKYEMQSASGAGKMGSRWVVSALDAK